MKDRSRPRTCVTGRSVGRDIGRPLHIAMTGAFSVFA